MVCETNLCEMRKRPLTVGVDGAPVETVVLKIATSPSYAVRVWAERSTSIHFSGTGVAVGGTGVGVTVGGSVGVDVGVTVGVLVGVAVGVFVGVAVGVAVGVEVGVLVGGKMNSRTVLLFCTVNAPAVMHSPSNPTSRIAHT
jgi:hypothetical protein